MRVALFTDTFPPEINGVAISTKSLRDVFIKNGHKVLVVTTNPFSNKVTFEDNIIRIPGIELKKIYGYIQVIHGKKFSKKKNHTKTLK